MNDEVSPGVFWACFLVGVLSLAVVAFLIGLHNMSDPPKHIGTEWHDATITGTNQPPYFSLAFLIDGRDVHAEVARHCSHWEMAKLGMKLKVPMEVYQRADGTKFSEPNGGFLAGKFCW